MRSFLVRGTLGTPRKGHTNPDFVARLREPEFLGCVDTSESGVENECFESSRDNVIPSEETLQGERQAREGTHMRSATLACSRRILA